MKKLIGRVTDNKKPSAVKEWKNPLLPIFYTFKVLGRFPFEKDELGGLRFRLLSPPSLWALLAISFQVAVTVRICFWKFTNSSNWASFNLVIASLQELIILNTTFHAFGTWKDTPALIRAFNRWHAFHKRFHTAVGREIMSPILNNSHWGIICSLIYALAIFTESILNHKVEFYVFGLELKEAVYSVCFFYFTIAVWCWVVYCLKVKTAAEILKEHISQKLSHVLAPEELAELRALWVELHSCTVEMTGAVGRTVLSCQTMSYLLTLFSLYATLMHLLVDNSPQIGHIPHALVHSLISGFLVYTLGHFAQQSMTENILFLLYSKRWQYFNSSVKVELDLLFDALEMSSPCFEISGLIIMNRRGYVELLNRLFTYLVILMQIKVSADGVT